VTLPQTHEGTIAKVHEQAIYLGGEDGPARCERLGIPPGGGIDLYQKCHAPSGVVEVNDRVPGSSRAASSKRPMPLS